MNVIVFDDNPEDRKQLVRIVNLWGTDRDCRDLIIREYDSIRDLKLLLQENAFPDLFFLDIMTPESTSAGFELAEKIHSENPAAFRVLEQCVRDFCAALSDETASAGEDLYAYGSDREFTVKEEGSGSNSPGTRPGRSRGAGQNPLSGSSNQFSPLGCFSHGRNPKRAGSYEEYLFRSASGEFES